LGEKGHDERYLLLIVPFAILGSSSNKQNFLIAQEKNEVAVLGHGFQSTAILVIISLYHRKRGRELRIGFVNSVIDIVIELTGPTVEIINRQFVNLFSKST